MPWHINKDFTEAFLQATLKVLLSSDKENWHMLASNKDDFEDDAISVTNASSAVGRSESAATKAKRVSFGLIGAALRKILLEKGYNKSMLPASDHFRNGVKGAIQKYFKNTLPIKEKDKNGKVVSAKAMEKFRSIYAAFIVKLYCKYKFMSIWEYVCFFIRDSVNQRFLGIKGSKYGYDNDYETVLDVLGKHIAEPALKGPEYCELLEYKLVLSSETIVKYQLAFALLDTLPYNQLRQHGK